MPLVRATPLGHRPYQGRSPTPLFDTFLAGRSPASHPAAEPLKAILSGGAEPRLTSGDGAAQKKFEHSCCTHRAIVQRSLR